MGLEIASEYLLAKTHNQGCSQDFGFFGGAIYEVGLVGGGIEPPDVREFLKIAKRKMQKCYILGYFTQNFQNPALNFSLVWTKNVNGWGIFEIL